MTSFQFNRTAGPDYLFNNVKLIWSVVEEGVEGITLCGGKKFKKNLFIIPCTMYASISGENIISYIPCLPEKALGEDRREINM